MTLQQHSGNDELLVRRYDYDDGWVVVADLGVGDGDVDVDVVDGTAIVVVEADGRVREFELSLPQDAAEVLIRNGVVTIKGRQ